MSGQETSIDYVQEFLRLSKLLDASLGFLKEQSIEFSVAEDEYRCSHATALLAADGKTADQRKAQADLRTSKERRRAHLADGMRQAALEAVRSRRAQLSALQSASNVSRAEAELAGRYDRDAA